MLDSNYVAWAFFLQSKILRNLKESDKTHLFPTAQKQGILYPFT